MTLRPSQPNAAFLRRDWIQPRSRTRPSVLVCSKTRQLTNCCSNPLFSTGVLTLGFRTLEHRPLFLGRKQRRYSIASSSRNSAKRDKACPADQKGVPAEPLIRVSFA